MNKSYYPIPKILEGKTIAFTGIYPGVGKTYTYIEFAKQLKAKGYKVIESGTTQKSASIIGSNLTVAKKSLNAKNNWNVKSKHLKTNAFYMIDEAFMMDQSTLNNLKAAYPHCCFILFGDPMQFEPASGNSPITKINLLFSLDKMMRTKDQDIIDALKMIKDGKLPLDFIYKHTNNDISDSMLMLCYKKTTSAECSDLWNDIPGVTLYRAKRRETYNLENDENKYFSVLDEVCNGDIYRLTEIENNYDKTIESYNLYTLEKISGDRKVITIDYDTFKLHFEKKNALNCHKIQGDTIRKEGSDICVWFDKEIAKHNQTFLRFLYVAISRAEYSSQIHFFTEQIKEIVQDFKENEPLKDYLNIAHNQKVVHTSSSELCSTDILDYILSKYDCSNKHDFELYIGENSAYLNNNNLLVMGNTSKSIIDTSNVSVQIMPWEYQRCFCMTLQNQLDNRQLIEIPGKGKNFVTINNTLNGSHKAGSETEYNWFVFEIDEIDGEKVTPEQIEKYFIGTKGHAPKYPEAKKHSFRIIYSGNKSYHFWIYIDNEELNKTHSRELYKAVHDYLNNKLFNGWADKSISTPEHLVRAPKCIRPDTGKEQTLVSFKGKKTLHIDNIMSLLPEPEEPTIVVQPSKDGSVEQAFELYKNDIPTTNGGRGKKILSKLYKEYYRGFLTKEQLKDLARMLCEHANCPEKIKHMISYINEM